jgi:antitoxin component YwqK of YwqJK toxin-antitoxin module
MKYKVIFLIFVFFSCSNSQDEIVETYYYPDTDIVSSIKVFKSIADNENGTFRMSEYDSLGNIMRTYNLFDSVLTGRFTEYFSNGNISYTVNFVNGIENGISKYYNQDGFLITELFIKNEYPLIARKFTFFVKSKTKGYSIFLLKNDTVVDTEGEIMYDSLLNKIIDTSTYYYNVQRIDNSQNEDIILNISLLGTKYDEYKKSINLILGELNIEDYSNKRYRLKDTIGIIKSDHNELELRCKQYNFENGLITGLLQVEFYTLDGKEKIRDTYFTFYYDLNSD